ncbi:MAG: methyltransferase domain-containing protein [Balneolaceae bacterium]|jgi:ubiquinone/menaquinone biosynthesis C-methylase UbiE|nr:methyltransferase domain-containing protein [Balneolaceae bacterium]
MHTHEKLLDKLEINPDDEILDVSAGTGLMAEAILKKFGNVRKLVLNDPSAKMLEEARYRLRYEEAEYTSHFAEELPFDDSSFSQIICLNAFHYYTEQQKALGHFRRLLKPGGTLWLQDWNRSGWFVILNQFISQLTPEHINTRSEDEFKKMLADAGFSIRESDRWSYKWWKFFYARCE